VALAWVLSSAPVPAAEFLGAGAAPRTRSALASPPAFKRGAHRSDTDLHDPLLKLRWTDGEIRAVEARRVPDWSPEADVRQMRIDRLLRAVLDYDEISRRALESTWPTLTATQQRVFVDTFSRLTDQVFLTKLPRQRTRLSYDSESITGQQASVMATASEADAKGRPPEHIEYRLSLKGDQWLITDVLIDGTSMVATYQRQFRMLVKREGFDGLMLRMRNKLSRDDGP
jgi:phospholipid transport system substrate-binding protein